MSLPNKHGLTRYIPADIKHKIRVQCGFGCVICGMGIIQYEHVEPEFSEAREHDPKKMTLLCGACHDKVTRKIWSKEKVKEHAKNPKCLEVGYSSDFFEIGKELPIVKFGASEWSNTPTIIEAFDETILGFTLEPRSGLLEISGVFHDDDDHEIFRIEKNEWRGDSSYFDIETVGPRLTIRKQSKTIALQIYVEPPNLFVVEEINMLYRGARIVGAIDKGFVVISPDSSTIAVSNLKGNSCEAGVKISENGIGVGYKCKSLTF